MRVEFMHNSKVSIRITIYYALIFSIVLIVLNAAILHTSKFFLIRESTRQITKTSSTMVDQITQKGKNSSQNLYDDKLFNQILFDANVSVNIINYDDYIINSSENKLITFIPIDGSFNKIHTLEKGKFDYIYMNRIVTTQDNKLFYIQVFKRLDNEGRFLRMLFFLMCVSDVIGVFLSILVGFWISKKMLKPINSITAAAQNISINDLNRRINISGPNDELKNLADTFDEMISRLQNSSERQNKFVSDASHELRTPISVINGYINMLDRWGKDDENILKESISVIKNETLSMTHLIERLLFLARGDSGILKVEMEVFNLNELLEEIITENKFIAPNHSLSFTCEKDSSILADRKMIKQMLRALIDNSIKYSSEKDGETTITAVFKGEHVTLTLTDNGIGIPSEELPYVFNRFYRVNKARGDEDDKGGTGLGLSIVKSIIDAHRGKISIDSAVGIGTTITIVLPVS